MRKILIIDDSKMDCALVIALFKNNLNLEITTANDTSTADSILSREKFDIIILDVRLTSVGREGYIYLLDLKSRISTKNVPVIVVSGDNRESARKLAIDLGASEYVEKGILSKDCYLEKLVNALIEQMEK